MGILSKIFGGGNKSKSGSSMTPQMAEQIIQSYGAVMQTQTPAPGCVADSNDLPYRKEQIKEALIIGLKSTNDQQMKEMLKVGYIQLADWQEGVGNSAQGLDLSNMDLNDDPTKLAQAVLGQSAGHEKWAPVVEAEQKALKQELVNLGLW